ncbi:MAG TPA: hypothetical protein VN083_11715 [Vicinamibacteria bacterium]|nr:hypothetical protein [Vicinamibacteria bacterium]
MPRNPLRGAKGNRRLQATGSLVLTAAAAGAGAAGVEEEVAAADAHLLLTEASSGRMS